MLSSSSFQGLGKASRSRLVRPLVGLFAIALLSGYSYARLAGRFPGPGGIMEYFDRAFPWRVLAGGLSILFLISLLIALTMIAKTFGAYAGRLALGDHSSPLIADAFASAIELMPSVCHT